MAVPSFWESSEATVDSGRISKAGRVNCLMTCGKIVQLKQVFKKILRRILT